MTDHEHAAHHVHADGRHGGLLLGAGTGAVHHLGRRRFITDLGRGVMAVAILGVVAACSDDDGPSGADPTDADSATTAPPTATDASEGTGSEGTGSEGTGSEDGGGSELRWAQAALGSVSAYVLVRGSEAAVVDTGTSGSADRIGEVLATLGVTFDDVRHVVLTHSHGDHVGSLADVLGRATEATAYAGTLDLPAISAPREVVGVGDGDDVFGLQVIDTPGHTPGSISVLDPGIGLLVAGDALNGNGDGTGLTGADARFTADMAAADGSLAKLAALDADIEAIAMGHGQPVTSDAGSLLRNLADSL